MLSFSFSGIEVIKCSASFVIFTFFTGGFSADLTVDDCGCSFPLLAALSTADGEELFPPSPSPFTSPALEALASFSFLTASSEAPAELISSDISAELLSIS